MKAKQTAATAALFSAVLSVTPAWANLLLAPGFEAPAPDSSVKDQPLVGPLSPSVPVGQNPWFYGKSNTAAAGSTAFYSSDIPPFSGATPSNRLNSTPTGAPPPSFKANDGNQYGYAYTVGQNSGQSTYIAQGVTGASVVAGDTYQASAYFFNKNVAGGSAADGDRLQASGSFDSLQLVFLDSVGAVISSAQSDAHIDSATTANTWTQISFSAAAPVGTTAIVFEAMVTRGATGGVMFVDSASLDNVSTPEPASLALLSVGGVALLRRRRV